MALPDVERTPHDSDMATITVPHIAPQVRERSESRRVDEITSMEEIPYARIYVTSILAVAALFLLGVGTPLAMYLDDFWSGMGLGGMCALWGGPSFGVMAGSARVSGYMERLEDH